MPPTKWLPVIRIVGPNKVWAFAVETSEPLLVRLVRDNNNVLVQQVVMPGSSVAPIPWSVFDHAWAPAWSMHPADGYLIVPEQTSLTLEAEGQLPKKAALAISDGQYVFYNHASN